MTVMMQITLLLTWSENRPVIRIYIVIVFLDIFRGNIEACCFYFPCELFEVKATRQQSVNTSINLTKQLDSFGCLSLFLHWSCQETGHLEYIKLSGAISVLIS